MGPPVYRPQPLPRVLQTKKVHRQNSKDEKLTRRPAVPRVFRPEITGIAQLKIGFVVRVAQSKHRLASAIQLAKDTKKGANPIKAAAAAARAKNEKPPDIEKKYNAQKACVLHSLFVFNEDVFGCKSAKDLHETMWAKNSKYSAYQQYSDDATSDKLYLAAKLTKVDTYKGKKVSEMLAALAQGSYIVTIKGKPDDHMVALTGKKDEWNWTEYDQRHNSGWIEYKVDDNALVDVIYKV